MCSKTALFGVMAIAILITVGTLNAAITVPITDVYGHNEKTNYAGVISDMIIGSGMNGYDNDGSVTWPAGEGLPSAWSATSNAYGAEWQSGDLLDDEAPVNGNIGWAVFDLGSAIAGLDELYLWNIRENNARAVNAYNIYYTTSPTVPVPHGPTGTTSTDYDFRGGGDWTQVGGTYNMSYRSTDGVAVNDVVSLGGVTARYIAIEILSNGGDTDRTGLAEVGVTAIPEPGTLALIGLGGLMIARRRRR